MDSKGVDCSKLKLGDSYLSTSSPARGKLYSCNPKIPLRQVVVPNASPGLISSTTNGTSLKNFGCRRVTFELPKELTETSTESGRKIEINNVPKVSKIGDWPMNKHQILTEIDANPGVPAVKSLNFLFAKQPVWSDSPGCLSLGAIGITNNGVVL